MQCRGARSNRIVESELPIDKGDEASIVDRIMTPLATWLAGSPYVGYAYAYPHKTAYRPLDPPLDLAALWQAESRSALSLYLHVPFCEHRCGFCNLFTMAQPAADAAARYLAAIEREADAAAAAVLPATFARLAIGGGTPTFLSVDELARLLRVASRLLGTTSLSQVPTSIEVSPATIDVEKLALLHDFGADRISIGVQAFDETSTRGIGRPQSRRDVDTALGLIRASGIPVLNIDLIYGGDGQTLALWNDSLAATLAWQPEELYLYPLYVRPLTGLGRREREWDDDRLALYRHGRDRLLASGYEQVSMRMFRLPLTAETASPDYSCQVDGMLGLGCGARSYTSSVHYSSEYAVGKSGVLSILAAYLERSREAFSSARYGIRLDTQETRRRHLILSLLQAAGLDRQAYERRFSRDVLGDFPQLRELLEHRLATLTPELLTLTAEGLERSDLIGPWLYSEGVERRSEEFVLM